MKPIDLERVHTASIKDRANKICLEKSARAPSRGRSFADFVASLPDLQAGSDFKSVVAAVVHARRGGRPVILGIGAHVIKCGLSKIIIYLMERGVVGAVAMNGAGAIHDVELAMFGATSEDVASGLKDGSFGMARETGEFINGAVNEVFREPGKGMGSLIGERLRDLGETASERSILAAGHGLGIPVTVHVALGTDIVHMHPSADGAAIGQATFEDFRRLAAVMTDFTGGVYLNIGSSVVLPEVFLKAFTVAQNLGADLHDFVTVNMDMIPHYRPSENVVRRPAAVGGVGYTITGRHEIMFPMLAQAIIDNLQ